MKNHKRELERGLYEQEDHESFYTQFYCLFSIVVTIIVFAVEKANTRFGMFRVFTIPRCNHFTHDISHVCQHTDTMFRKQGSNGI
jgi:hypothetical protein